MGGAIQIQIHGDVEGGEREVHDIRPPIVGFCSSHTPIIGGFAPEVNGLKQEILELSGQGHPEG